MLTWCVSTVLLIAAQADGAKLTPIPAAARGDASAQLKERVAKVATAGSYAFDSTVESEGGFGGGRRGGDGGGAAGGGAGGAPGGATAGGQGAPPSDPTIGKVEIGKSAELKRGESIAYKTGTKLVYKKGETWETYTPPDMSSFGGGPPGGAGGGAAGGGTPPAGGAGGGRGQGGGFGGGREMRTLMSFANNPLPHEILAGFETKLKDIKATEAGGKWTFTGTLTDEAADDISGAKRMREAFGGRGGGAPGGAGAGGGNGGAAPTPPSGTASIVFGADGNVEQVVLETKSAGFGGAESKRKQTIALKDWGKTKVEVPAAAAAKLTG